MTSLPDKQASGTPFVADRSSGAQAAAPWGIGSREETQSQGLGTGVLHLAPLGLSPAHAAGDQEPQSRMGRQDVSGSSARGQLQKRRQAEQRTGRGRSKAPRRLDAPGDEPLGPTPMLSDRLLETSEAGDGQAQAQSPQVQQAPGQQSFGRGPLSPGTGSGARGSPLRQPEQHPAGSVGEWVHQRQVLSQGDQLPAQRPRQAGPEGRAGTQEPPHEESLPQAQQHGEELLGLRREGALQQSSMTSEGGSLGLGMARRNQGPVSVPVSEDVWGRAHGRGLELRGERSQQALSPGLVAGARGPAGAARQHQVGRTEDVRSVVVRPEQLLPQAQAAVEAGAESEAPAREWQGGRASEGDSEGSRGGAEAGRGRPSGAGAAGTLGTESGESGVRWREECSGVVAQADGPVTCSKTVYENETSYLLRISLPAVDLASVRLTWQNVGRNSVVKVGLQVKVQ